MDGQIDEQMERQMDRQINRWKDRWTDRQIDGWFGNRWIHIDRTDMVVSLVHI